MKFKGMKQAGFSLVELMVVVGIIGILAAIAVPKLQNFSAKAKQSEARTNLRAIDTLQQSYYAENSTYAADLATAGWDSAVTGRKYAYDMSTAGTTAVYQARAQWGSAATARLCPSATTRDTWVIDQTGALSNSVPGACN